MTTNHDTGVTTMDPITTVATITSALTDLSDAELAEAIAAAKGMRDSATKDGERIDAMRFDRVAIVLEAEVAIREMATLLNEEVTA